MPEPLQFLVIDENLDTRFLRRRALQKAFPGCEIIEADECRSALLQTAGQTVDAIISDQHLQGVEGQACIRHLRACGLRCPIIVVTASEDPHVHAAAYRAGVDRVFWGPDAELIQHLRAVLAPAKPV